MKKQMALFQRNFINKVGMARKEARETRYWVRLIDMTGLINNLDNNRELEWRLNESEELMKILSSIMNKAKKSK